MDDVSYKRPSMKTELKRVATALLFDREGRLCIYLRDNKPTIPFPNYWDLFGGHVEPGETSQEALLRELREELGVQVSEYGFFRSYHCLVGDAAPNVKDVYWVKTHQVAEELELHEGAEFRAIPPADRHAYQFANILPNIIEDYFDESATM